MDVVKTPMSFEIFDWKELRQVDEIEVLDHNPAIARGVIENLDCQRAFLRLAWAFASSESGHSWPATTLCCDCQ